MGDIFSVIANTPVPTILVLGGILFIFLGLGGRIKTEQIPSDTRKYFAIAGSIFVLGGVFLFALPKNVNTEGVITPMPFVESTVAITAPSVIPLETEPSEYDRIVATVSALNQLAATLYGPASGNLTSENDDSLECRYIDEIVINAIIIVKFTYPSQYENWSFGLVFRDLGTNQEYRLKIIQDDSWEARWYRLNADGERISTTIDGGKLSNLLKGENIPNEIKLYVKDESAFFYFDEKYISEIDVSQVQRPGDIGVCIDFNDVPDGQVINYQDFTVWSLP